MLVVNKNL